MALVKLAPHLTGIRNSVGTGTYSSNKAGLYLRERVTPSNPKTSFQIAARARVTAISQAWRNITNAQRLAWEVFSENLTLTNVFGKEFIPSGSNSFMKINVNRLILNKPLLSSPPPLTYPVPLTFFAPDVMQPDEMNLDFSPSPIPPKHHLFLWAFPGQSAGKSFFHSEYRFFMIFPPGTSNSFEFSAVFVSRFGMPISGQKIGFRGYLVHEDTGLSSSMLSFVSLIVH